MECKICNSPFVENKETGLCASCGARMRKFERDTAKAVKNVLKKQEYKIPKISDKLKAELVTYARKRKEHLEKHPDCQAKLIGCNNDRKTNQLHHLAKRGNNLNKSEYFMTVCMNCHNQIERSMSAPERRKKGLLITPKT